MISFRHFCALAVLGAAMLAGCSAPHGQPAKGSEIPAPNEVLEFRALYGENCAGCHGADGKGGAAISLSDPVYLAIVDDDTLRKDITNGIKGTSMAAFGQSAGGMLTSKQIDVLVSQIRARWAKPGILARDNLPKPPSYAATTAGDITRGEAAYKTFCESCHGPDGRGGPKGSSITDGSFLALLTDQELRTMVIVGRPDRNAPDWTNNVPGRPMSDQEISDVVAWLVSHRIPNPGQPYATANKAQH